MAGDKAKRDKIAAKIRALMAKTVENGCTEDEAISAAAKVAAMLGEHDLTVDEVNLREDGFAERERPVVDVVDAHLWKVASRIADLCQVKSWTLGEGRLRRGLVFFGLATDVEVAGYILAIAERAMRDGSDRFKATHALMRASVRRSRLEEFVKGMADRLAERIGRIAWTRRREAKGLVGGDLVVAKLAVVEAELVERGIVLEEMGDRGFRAGTAYYDQGREAAEGVGFDASVKREGAPVAALTGEADR